MNVLAIIPARGGSKSLPRKNLRLLAGKPLIYYVIQTALHSVSTNRTIVSTDDQQISDMAQEYGAEVPFRRPLELSGDAVPDFPVLLHAVNYLQENEDYYPDIVVHLRPTYPLIIPEDIDRTVTSLIDNQVDSARTICPVSYHPYWMKELTDGWLVPLMETKGVAYRRQDLPPIYRTSGVDATKTRCLTEEQRIIGEHVRAVLTDRERVIDIDTSHDLILAECLLNILKKDIRAPDWWK